MSQDKKVAAETKLTEEEKLFEEKNVANPYIAGFIESMAKSNTEKITKEILEGLSEDILVTVTVMMQKVEEKIPRIDPGDQVMQFSENRPSRKVTSKT
jgi:hypothetical protein